MRPRRFSLISLSFLFFAIGYFRSRAIENKRNSTLAQGEEQVRKISSYVPHRVRATATQTGAWKLPDGYEYYFDESLASAMVQHFQRKKKNWGKANVLEFGSGTGKYIDYFRDNKINARGYDGVHDIYVRSGGAVSHADLTEHVKLGSADFVVCLEVAEHIPKKYEEIFLKNVLTHCEQSLILSWAPPSQGGVGHVNTKERADVVELLYQKGFQIDEGATNMLLRAATLPWFKENLMVFNKM